MSLGNSGMKVYLRTLLKEDAGAMLEWMHNPELKRIYQKDFTDFTIGDCEAFICKSQMHDSNELHLAVVAEERYAGTVSLKHISHSNHSAEFAISIHPSFQHKGIGREAINQMAKIGFGLLGLDSIYLYVRKTNEPANQFYHKAGCQSVSHDALLERGVLERGCENEDMMNWYLLPKE